MGREVDRFPVKKGRLGMYELFNHHSLTGHLFTRRCNRITQVEPMYENRLTTVKDAAMVSIQLRIMGVGGK